MSAVSSPFVSVLTPVYNGEDYLAECIESVLGQTHQNLEYLIVNNCSTDRTLEVAQRYAARDRRIQVLTNDRFVGVIANHNGAFRRMSTQAKYCKVVSADDFIFPDCIQRMVELAEENPTVGFIGAYQLSGHVVKWQGFRYPQSVFPGRQLCREVILRKQAFLDGQPLFGFGTPTSLMYRADLVRGVEEFYPNPSPHSDTSACFRDLSHCDFGFIYQVLSFERTHEKTQTSKSVDMNRHISGYLSDILTYGRQYLNEDELVRTIDEVLWNYHRYLASNVFKSRDPSFWEYHKSRLRELGFPLTRRQLVKAMVRAGLLRAPRPRAAA